MPNILLTNYYSETPLEVIRKLVPDGFTISSLQKPGKEEILKYAHYADYFMVGGRVKIDSDIIEAAPNLRLVQRTGVGLDSLDLGLLESRGIPIRVNAGVNSRSVAEHTLMLILATLRKLPVIDASVKSGEWKKHEWGIRCNDLSGKTVGLIGLGCIGRTVAQMLQPFDVKTIYYNRTRLAAEMEKELGVEYRGYKEVLQDADILSLHCPLTDETRHMIGAVEFDQMKQGIVIINTARGALMDESAFLSALKNGKVSAAGLDVFYSEPVVSRNELLQMPNVVLTPHMSGLTFETFQNMMSVALRSIAEFHETGSI